MLSSKATCCAAIPAQPLSAAPALSFQAASILPDSNSPPLVVCCRPLPPQCVAQMAGVLQLHAETLAAAGLVVSPGAPVEVSDVPADYTPEPARLSYQRLPVNQPRTDPFTGGHVHRGLVGHLQLPGCLWSPCRRQYPSFGNRRAACT
jgi:hypothetical protein